MKTLLPVALAGALLAPAAAFAASPFDGTWKTDLASVKLPTRPDVYVVNDGMHVCNSCTPSYTVKADGAFHPIPGHPAVDEVALKIVDAHTLQQTDRKGGRVVSTARITASPDGNTATVAWTDTTNPGTPAISGVSTGRRVSRGPPGSHVLSGGWTADTPGQMSDDARLQTLKLDGGMLSYSTPTRQSYMAKVDGPAAPFKGDPNVTTVSVKRAGPRELVETDMHDGKVVSTVRMTVSPDGRKMMWSAESLKTHTTTTGAADKV